MVLAWSFVMSNTSLPTSSPGLTDDSASRSLINLSRNEKEAVKASWTLARQNYDAAGLGFFRAFFTAHPQYQKLFKGFANVPLENLGGNNNFKEHARNVMNAISLVVDSLDEPSALVPVLKELGRNHARRSIQTVHFHNLAVVLVDFLEGALGRHNFSNETKLSWKKTLNAVINVIETGLKLDAAQPPPPSVNNNKGWALQLFKNVSQSHTTRRGLFLVFSLYLVYVFNRKRGLSLS